MALNIALRSSIPDGVLNEAGSFGENGDPKPGIDAAGLVLDGEAVRSNGLHGIIVIYQTTKLYSR